MSVSPRAAQGPRALRIRTVTKSEFQHSQVEIAAQAYALRPDVVGSCLGLASGAMRRPPSSWPAHGLEPTNQGGASGTRADNNLVSRERLHSRTREIASGAGRPPSGVAQCDYEQAKRELTGERDSDRQEARLTWAGTP